jgi:DUF1365 family protein
MVKAALYESVVRHQRSTPIRYGLRHRTYFWLVDLDQLPRLPRPLRPLAQFLARDHLGDPALSIRDNVLALMRSNGVLRPVGRITMLTQARVLGYAFNPITVYWCHGMEGELICVVAEVHNTYGGRHCYVLSDSSTSTQKRLYVSPFFDVSGEYRMRLPEPGERLRLAITLDNGRGRPFNATLTGRRMPATTAALLYLSVRYPVSALVNMARIRWHGIRLYLKGLPVVPRGAES